MQTCLLAVVLALWWPLTAPSQELKGAERARILETARGRYYSLTGLGVKQFTCTVSFDLSTISKGMLPEADTADRFLLNAATFTLTVTPKGPSLHYKFPDGAVSQSQDVVAGITMWITEIVQGFFQTWPSKGLRGPIPPDKQVESLMHESEGYRLTVKDSAGTSDLVLDKNLLVREIATREKDGQIDEHLAFAATPSGLVFRGNETQDKTREGITKVRYTIEQSQVNGLMLPSEINLIIGDHMNVKFALTACRATMTKR